MHFVDMEDPKQHVSVQELINKSRSLIDASVEDVAARWVRPVLLHTLLRSPECCCPEHIGCLFAHSVLKPGQQRSIKTPYDVLPDASTRQACAWYLSCSMQALCCMVTVGSSSKHCAACRFPDVGTADKSKGM